MFKLGQLKAFLEENIGDEAPGPAGRPPSPLNEAIAADEERERGLRMVDKADATLRLSRLLLPELAMVPSPEWLCLRTDSVGPGLSVKTIASAPLRSRS